MFAALPLFTRVRKKSAHSRHCGFVPQAAKAESWTARAIRAEWNPATDAGALHYLEHAMGRLRRLTRIASGPRLTRIARSTPGGAASGGATVIIGIFIATLLVILGH
jgi:hypothetical protein